MELHVTGRKFEVTDAILTHTQDRAAKLPRYFDRVRSADVILDKADSHEFGVEFVVHIDGSAPAVATGKHADLHACIDQTVAKVERQLHDLKEKQRNMKHSA